MQNSFNQMQMMMNNPMGPMMNGPGFGSQPQNQFISTSNSNNRVMDNQNVLMVGDIRKDVTQDQLHSHFQTFQVPFKSLQMRQTRGNYNIAFIKCNSDGECQAIKSKSNHTRLNNKPIRVFFKKTRDELEKQQNSKANLIVKNLDPSIDGFQMDNIFNKFGKIVSSKISTDYDGKSLGYGYIQFENEEQARTCQQSFKESNNVQVDHFTTGKIKEYQTNNLYIKGFPKNMSEEKLRAKLIPIFEQFGTIGSFKFVSREMAGGPMMFAFICYQDNESAQQALNQMNEKDVFNTGDVLNVNWFQKKGDREKLLKREFSSVKNNINLFMKGLKETVTLDSFYQVFKKFGNISKYDIKKANDQKISQLMAFCSYENESQARQAKESGNDPEVQDLFVNGKVIIYFWLPKQILQRKKDQIRSQKGSNNQDQLAMVMNMFQNMFGNYFPGRMIQPMMGQPNMMKKMPVLNQQIVNKPMNHMGMNMNMNHMNMNHMNMNRFGQPIPQMQNPQMMNPQMIQQPIMHQNMPMGNFPRQQFMNQGMPQNIQQKPVSRGPKQNINKNFSSPQDILENIEQFKSLDSDSQRKILGEQLYPKVSEVIMASNPKANQQIPKITGMLIDFEVFEVEEIIGFFNEPQNLSERIKEAQELLEESQQ